jgi:hypothetical protein
MEIFTYSEELSGLIDGEKELAYSSSHEVQIRAATVIAVDQILSLVQSRADPTLTSHLNYAYQVDWVLWQMGESKLDEMAPHHRVLSIFY